MPEELDIMSFATVEQLWSWLEQHHLAHPGIWVHLQKANSAVPSVSFHDVLEAGIAYGWSESTRRGYDSASYLQKFTPGAREAPPRTGTSALPPGSRPRVE